MYTWKPERCREIIFLSFCPSGYSAICNLARFWEHIGKQPLTRIRQTVSGGRRGGAASVCKNGDGNNWDHLKGAVNDMTYIFLKVDEKRIGFKELKRAVDKHFKDDSALRQTLLNRVRRFGSGDETAVEMANRVAGVVHDAYAEQTSYRGGRYTARFWSMSQHFAYGSLSGALPSGRLAKNHSPRDCPPDRVPRITFWTTAQPLLRWIRKTWTTTLPLT